MGCGVVVRGQLQLIYCNSWLEGELEVVECVGVREDQDLRALGRVSHRCREGISGSGGEADSMSPVTGLGAFREAGNAWLVLGAELG